MKTHAILDPNDAGMPVPVTEGIARIFSIRALWLIASQALVTGGYFLVTSLRGQSIDPIAVGWAFVVMQAAWIGGQALSIWPRGNVWAEARLYLSTGFRSGVPLVASILLDLLVYPGLLPGGLAILLLLYVVGLVFSVYLTVRGIEPSRS